jgi:hypothetical protein
MRTYSSRSAAFGSASIVLQDVDAEDASNVKLHDIRCSLLLLLLLHLTL